jgi:hypothetical protein
MAAQSNTVNTGLSLRNWWKKVQGPIADKAFAHGKRAERALYNALASWDVPASAYETTFPIDLNERGGVASIPDGGFMAKPSSVNAVEGNCTVIHLNKRFSVSDLTRFTDAGTRNQMKRQITAQALQAADAITEDFSDRFHGSASGVIAQTNSNFSSTAQTLTLTNGYGNANITNARFLASMIKPGERLAFLDGVGALIDANGFGLVTGVNKSTGVINVTTDGAVTYSTDGINIVKANNLEGLTVAGGTDWGRGLVGMQDILFATSVHGVSGSTNPNWTVALNISAAGLFTPQVLKRMRQEIMNESGLEADYLVVAQGVERSMIAQERAGLRYNDTSFSFDGDVKAKGLKVVSTKNVPPGYAVTFASAGLNKWESYNSTNGAGGYSDLQPSEDLAGGYGRLDWVGNMMCLSRKAFAVATSQTEA